MTAVIVVSLRWITTECEARYIPFRVCAKTEAASTGYQHASSCEDKDSSCACNESLTLRPGSGWQLKRGQGYFEWAEGSDFLVERSRTVAQH